MKSLPDLIQKQAHDHAMISREYASYACKLRLKSSKQVCLHMDLPATSPFSSLTTFRFSDEASVVQFKRSIKEWISIARQLISDLKESFDNQLKIQNLKDTIFGINERLASPKKNREPFTVSLPPNPSTKSRIAVRHHVMNDITYNGSIFLLAPLECDACQHAGLCVLRYRIHQLRAQDWQDCCYPLQFKGLVPYLAISTFRIVPSPPFLPRHSFPGR